KGAEQAPRAVRDEGSRTTDIWGGVIVPQQNRPMWLKVNRTGTSLAGRHEDHGGNGQNDNRICTHLHGGFVPWTSDGGPFGRSDPHGHVGPGFMPSVNGRCVPGPVVLSQPAEQPADVVSRSFDRNYATERIRRHCRITARDKL